MSGKQSHYGRTNIEGLIFNNELKAIFVRSHITDKKPAAPFEIFLTPQIYVIKVLNIPYNLLTVAIATLAPTFIYGLSIRISREKISKRQRYMRNTRKRYER